MKPTSIAAVVVALTAGAASADPAAAEAEALATFECEQFDGSGHTVGLAATGPLPTARSGARAAVLGNNVYVIGGQGSAGDTLATVDVFPLQ